MKLFSDAGSKKRLRLCIRVMFVCYLALLVYFLFFSEAYGRMASQERHYNLVPFLEIRRFLVYARNLGWQAVLTNLLGNILGFIPLGFCLPVFYPGLRRPGRVCLLGFLFSLGVELAQLVTGVGSFDVDDMILNTLGTFLGWVIFTICLALLAERRPAPPWVRPVPLEPGQELNREEERE